MLEQHYISICEEAEAWASERGLSPPWLGMPAGREKVDAAEEWTWERLTTPPSSRNLLDITDDTPEWLERRWRLRQYLALKEEFSE
jgi:hypothetical protein